MIPFNKPYLTGKETHYIYEDVSCAKLSGNEQFADNTILGYNHKKLKLIHYLCGYNHKQ